jgi:alanyl-tRNA synthetase
VWTSGKVRSVFLEFFKDKQHTSVESSSLVPVNDPTLLFSNAGMNQFKDVFLGIDKRNYTRAVSVQKCVRAGGKHNDLDTVGRTPRHHTFFEMLGNFSFGDYFKKEAIAYAWEFLTEVIQLPKERLWVTVYQDDDEASQLWQQVAGISPDRIIRLGEKDNFWSMGDTGPCGPCSEILYDRGEEFTCGNECGIGICDCDRWLEIWNLVFMQYNRGSDGEITPLPRPSIDTGMGLERLTSILQKVPSNYDTDLFVPIIKHLENMSGIQYNPGDPGFPFRVIADHSRSSTFLIADGVIPSNDGRGYVLRRIIRRAVRFGRLLGIHQAFLHKNVDIVVDLMQDAYPDLESKRDFIKKVIQLEEERFSSTLNEGLKKVEEIISQARKEGQKVLPGEAVFMLYDTYGFPIDLTEDIADENGFIVDKKTFEQMMEEQRNRARESNKTSAAFSQEIAISDLLKGVKPTDFTGYSRINDTASVLKIIKDGILVESAEEGEVSVIVNHSPFYPEGGGQVSDRGVLTGLKCRIDINDVQKVASWIIHTGYLKGQLQVGDQVSLEVEAESRMDTQRNHTATHLLHKALRIVLGEHAQQKGSLVEPARLRFDFSHLSPLTEDELLRVENIVNQAIWATYEVSAVVTGIDQAREMGAIALFGEKYGEEVRVVQIGDFSLELCGGTHVNNTGQIGMFKIINETSIGSGLRRIEAVTGSHAVEYLHQLENELKRAAALLRTTAFQVADKIDGLNSMLKNKNKEIDLLKNRLAKSSVEDLINKAYIIKDTSILIEAIEVEDVGILRENAEKIKDKLGRAIVMLAAPVGGKVALICFVSKDLVEQGVHAGKIVGAAAKAAGGGGGGRPDMAQAGAREIDKIPDALNAAQKLIEKTLA